MRSLAVFAALAAFVIAPGAALAQIAPRDAVLEQLREASAEAAGEGYRASPRVFDTRSVVGMLPRGGSVVLEASLRAGVRYTVVAVCDAECVDLDLRVHAPGGEAALDEDVATDNVPVLTFTAPATGPHPLTVVMSECRAELCWFGLRVLAR